MTRSAWGLDTTADVDWRVRAACSPETAEWFWLVQGHRTKLTLANKAALALCRTCPVIAECARYEAENPQPFARIAGGKAIAP